MDILYGCPMAGASPAFAQIYAKVDTNSILKGYAVQKNGRTVCKDPQVWNDFRGGRGASSFADEAPMSWRGTGKRFCAASRSCELTPARILCIPVSRPFQRCFPGPDPAARRDPG